MSEANVERWIERIKAAYLEGDISVANSLLFDALEETSHAPKLLEIAGMLAYIDEDYELSVELIERAMFELPMSISAQMTLANAKMKLRKFDDAAITLEFLVEQVGRVPCSMLADLTHAVSEIGRDDWAIETCLEASRRHPHDHEAIFAVGYYQWRLGIDLDVARTFMEQAVQMQPESSRYRILLSSLLVDLGDDECAYDQIKTVPLENLASINCDCRREQFRNLFRQQHDFLRMATVLKSDSKHGDES